MIKLLQWGLEAGLALAILAFAYAQILRPLIRGTPVFPIFRKRRQIERELEVVNESLEDKRLEEELAARQRELGEKQ